MKSVLFVTHCYSTVLPQYAGLLKFQLESLRILDNKIAGSISISVALCYNEDDVAVRDVYTYYRYHTPLDVRGIKLNIPMLGRRCIGRNVAALTNQCDMVWFTDCDHCFMEEAVLGLSRAWEQGIAKGTGPISMIFPKEIMIHKDHATGDKCVEDGCVQGRWGINPKDFIPKSYNRAIGGVQIVSGDWARRFGYLRDTDWQKMPDDKHVPFSDFRDDIAYRRACLEHGRIEGVDLPGVYRMRHSLKTHPD